MTIRKEGSSLFCEHISEVVEIIEETDKEHIYHIYLNDRYQFEFERTPCYSYLHIEVTGTCLEIVLYLDFYDDLEEVIIKGIEGIESVNRIIRPEILGFHPDNASMGADYYKFFPDMLGETRNDDSYTFDFERLKESMKSPFTMAPSGMSREEMRSFILDHAKKMKNNYTKG